MVENVRPDIQELLKMRPITEEIALRVKATPGYEHLLVTDGEWIGLEKDREDVGTGEQHAWIETLLLIALANWARKNTAGRVYPGDATFVLDSTPGQVRKMREPDVAFVASENVKPTEGFIYLAPDLAVEIISPSQDYSELRIKIDEYLTHGTQQVWLVLPRLKQIEVFYPNDTTRIYRIDDTITDEALLPGFSLSLSEIFEV